MKHKLTLDNETIITISDVEIEGNYSQRDTDSWVDAYIQSAWNEDANRICSDDELDKLNDASVAQEILFNHY